ncbi:MAG: ABC transporter substrate-binding protein [Bacteroidales bacterium]|nr:ABC transporter substrate-binding protein [Bacteroidales bacterium]
MIKNIAIAISVLLLTIACTSTPTDNAQNCDTIIDDYGDTVVVPHSPRRIVSTSPAVTEILFALHADTLMVGRTDFCTYPPEASEIESIGGISNLNVEKIVSLHPDLVISGSMVPQKNIRQLATLGIPVVCVIEKQNFNGLFANIEQIGKLTNHVHEADSLTAYIHQQLQHLQTAIDTSSLRPSVYYVVGFGSTGNFTAGGKSFINDIITMAGGTNMASNLDGWAYSLEALMEGDPDFIVVRREDSASFCNTHPYNRLSAVKNHRVIGINSALIDLQTPRNINAVIFLRKKIEQSPIR